MMITMSVTTNVYEHLCVRMPWCVCGVSAEKESYLANGHNNEISKVWPSQFILQGN